MGGLTNVLKQIICNRKIIKFNLTSNPQHVYYATRAFMSGKGFPISIKKAVIAVCCVSMGGGAYGYFNAMPTRRRQLTAAESSVTNSTSVIENLPFIEPSRKIDGPAKSFGLKLTLFQYQTCPFCCKVRAFLDYYGLPYDVVEVNPVMRQQIKFSKYRKVPILIAEENGSNAKHQLNDSSVIISTLGTLLLNPKSSLENAIKYYPSVTFKNEDGKGVTEFLNRYFLMYGEEQLDENALKLIENERKWREWADKVFVHTLSPNVYRTKEEALQAFNYFSIAGDWENNFSSLERLFVIYIGATAMYFVGKRLKKKHSLKSDVRESLYDVCKVWTKQIKPNEKFFGGKVPNLADLAVYGHLSSIEGCSAFQDILSHTNIGPWYFEVKKLVASNEGYPLIKSNEL